MENLTTACEIEISYRPSHANKEYIRSSSDGYNILKPFFPEETINLQERFVVVYLNRANRVLGVYNVSLGGMTVTLVDIRLILSVALKTGSTSFMLSHNHPSGSIKPSEADIQITNKIKEAGNLMELKVLDHLIISPVAGEYFSFADEGLI